MTPENLEAIRAAFIKAFDTLTPEQVRELTIEPYREFSRP